MRGPDGSGARAPPGSNARRPGDPDLRGFEWYYLRRLCDASTRTLRGHSGMVTGMAYSPDGRRLASAGYVDATFKIWDVGSGQLIWSGGQSDRVICVAYSPDGRHIAVGGGSDNTVQLWDAASGALIRTLRRALWGGRVGRVQPRRWPLGFRQYG